MVDNKNETVKWLKNEMENKIEVDKKISSGTSIRGVYGIFSFDEQTKEEVCLYVGKAINIYERIFKGTGHLVRIRKENYMLKTFRECIENPKKKMIIRVLAEVKYGYDNYNRDAQRLAFAEYTIIECFQRKNQCLDQVPEGGNKKAEKEKWNKMKEKHMVKNEGELILINKSIDSVFCNMLNCN